MEPTIWDLVQQISELRATLSGLATDVAWLTWAFRWLIGLTASTGIASVGAVYFSYRNHKSNNRKEKYVEDDA